MKFNSKDKDYIFKVVEISEVFFVKYFKEAPADAIKVYMYLQYATKYNKEITILEISENTSLTRKTIQDCLEYWESKGIILKRSTGYDCNSLQEIELHNRFTPKVRMTVDETIKTLEDKLKLNVIKESNLASNNNFIQNNILDNFSSNQEKIEAETKLKEKKKEILIKDINNRYFSGTMASHWYSRIFYWLEKYNFTEDLMLAIFEYSFKTGAKPAQYIETVSEVYYKEGIKTYSDFEKYLIKNEEVKKMSKYIKRKLNLVNNLTEHQETYVKKWVVDYGFKKEVFEYLFELLVNKNDVGFNYYDKILEDWNNQGLKSKKDIKAHVEAKRKEKEEEKQKRAENKKNETNSYKTGNKSKQNEIREQRVFEGIEDLME